MHEKNVEDGFDNIHYIGAKNMNEAKTASNLANLQRKVENFAEGLTVSLDEWDRWLLRGHNAEVFGLWRFIEDLIDTRERGVLQDVDTGFSAGGLRGALDAKWIAKIVTYIDLGLIDPDENELRWIFAPLGSSHDGPQKTEWLKTQFREKLGINISGDHIVLTRFSTYGNILQLNNTLSGRHFRLTLEGDSIRITERYISLKGKFMAEHISNPPHYEINIINRAAEIRYAIERKAWYLRINLGMVYMGDLLTESFPVLSYLQLGEIAPEEVEVNKVIEELSILNQANRMLQNSTLCSPLSECGQGIAFFTRLLEDNNHPLSPKQLLSGSNNDDNFLEIGNGPDDIQTAIALGEMAQQWISVQLQGPKTDQNIRRLIDTACRVLGSLDIDTQNDANTVISIVQDNSTDVARQGLKGFKAFLEVAERSHKDQLNQLGDAEATLGEELVDALDLVKTVLVYIDMCKVAAAVIESRKSGKYTDVIEESIKALINSWKLIDDIRHRGNPEPRQGTLIARQRWLLKRVDIITSFYDSVCNALRGVDAIQNNDGSMVATGYGLRAIGDAGSGLAALLKLLKVKGALAGVLVAKPTVIIFLILVITGWWFVRLFRKAPLVRAIEQSAFGKTPYANSHPVLQFERDEKRSFRWLKPDGKPDYAGQINSLRGFVVGVGMRGWLEAANKPEIRAIYTQADGGLSDDHESQVAILPLTISGPIEPPRRDVTEDDNGVTEPIEQSNELLEIPKKLVYLKGWFGYGEPAFIFTVPLYGVKPDNSIFPVYPQIDSLHFQTLRSQWETWFRVEGLLANTLPQSSDRMFHWHIKLLVPGPLVPNLGIPGIATDIDYIEAVLLDSEILNDDSVMQEVGILRKNAQIDQESTLDEVVEAGLGIACAQMVNGSFADQPIPTPPSFDNLWWEK